jgi:hypothetical protein
LLLDRPERGTRRYTIVCCMTENGSRPIIRERDLVTSRQRYILRTGQVDHALGEVLMRHRKLNAYAGALKRNHRRRGQQRLWLGQGVGGPIRTQPEGLWQQERSQGGVGNRNVHTRWSAALGCSQRGRGQQRTGQHGRCQQGRSRRGVASGHAVTEA